MAAFNCSKSIFLVFDLSEALRQGFEINLCKVDQTVTILALGDMKAIGGNRRVENLIEIGHHAGNICVGLRPFARGSTPQSCLDRPCEKKTPWTAGSGLTA